MPLFVAPFSITIWGKSTLLSTAAPEADVFITNFWQGPRPAGVDTQVSAEDAAKVKGYDGNVVIRVTDGGRKYKVAVTSDADGLMTVKSVSDQYTSR